MVLRLHELPPQYRIGDDSGCGPLEADPKETSVAYRAFVTAHRPRGCYFEYQRLFRVAGGPTAPLLVGSFAITTPSPAAAEEGAAVISELIGFAVGDEELEQVSAPATVGDATMLHHTDAVIVGTKKRRRGAALSWRSGRVLGAVYVGGASFAAADALALRLARIQQRHVERPTPYTKAQQDWTEVPLENPNVDFPVYWLGSTFRPGRGLPPSPLRDASLPLGPGEGPPGLRARLSYDRISLNTFTRASWRRWLADPLSDLVRSWRCTEGTEIALPKGRATIYAGYAKDYARCPRRPPDVFLAEVHLGRVVIGIDTPICGLCVESGRGPYYSEHALEIIARGLRLHRRVAD